MKIQQSTKKLSGQTKSGWIKVKIDFKKEEINIDFNTIFINISATFGNLFDNLIKCFTNILIAKVFNWPAIVVWTKCIYNKANKPSNFIFCKICGKISLNVYMKDDRSNLLIRKEIWSWLWLWSMIMSPMMESAIINIVNVIVAPTYLREICAISVWTIQ